MTDRTTLQSLEAAAKAATPGPWTYEVLPDTSDTTGIRIYSQGLLWDSRLQPGAQYPTEVVGGSCCCCGSVGVSYEKDAAYIAAANPSAILSLLSDLAAKDAEIGRLRAERDDVDALRQAIFRVLLDEAGVMVAPGEEPAAIRRLIAQRDEARALTQGDRNAG